MFSKQMPFFKQLSPQGLKSAFEFYLNKTHHYIHDNWFFVRKITWHFSMKYEMYSNGTLIFLRLPTYLSHFLIECSRLLPFQEILFYFKADEDCCTQEKIKGWK